MRVVCIDNTGVQDILITGQVYPIINENYNLDISKTYCLEGLGDMHKSHFKIHPYIFKNKNTGKYLELEERPVFTVIYPSGIDQLPGEGDYDYCRRKEKELENEWYSKWDEIEVKLIGFHFPGGGIVDESNAPDPYRWIGYFTDMHYKPAYKEFKIPRHE